MEELEEPRTRRGRTTKAIRLPTSQFPSPKSPTSNFQVGDFPNSYFRLPNLSIWFLTSNFLARDLWLPTSNFRLPASDVATSQILTSALPTSDVLCKFRLPGFLTSDFRFPTVDDRSLHSRFWLPTSTLDFRLHDFWLLISNFRLPTSVLLLPTSDFQPPTSDFRI